MKRIIFFLTIFCLLFSQITHSQAISESVAQSRAAVFFANQAQYVQGDIKKAPPRTNLPLTLAYTSQKDGNTCFYVYNRGENDGFVIIGGDEVAKEILAFVPQGHFVYDSLPDNMKWWLGQYEQEIDTAIIISSTQPTAIRKSAARSQASPTTLQDIPDLITTKWGQGYPYNTAIPLPPDQSEYSLTGCVPTAIAQIMNYWQYPLQGTGSNSYMFNDFLYSADFSNTIYDWTNMRNNYIDWQYSQQEAQAVATLMYHIGVALHVYYHPNETGYSPWIRDNGHSALERDLQQYFGFDGRMDNIYRKDFSQTQWESILYKELAAGRPVYYGGTNELTGIGHAFVCHGYSSSLDMYSINWGWEGEGDGYFAISGTNTLLGYCLDQEMLVGLRPSGYNTESNIMTYCDKFNYNGIWFRIIDEENKEVEVTHPYWSTDSDENYCSGNVTIPSYVTHNGESYNVTKIGTCAFWGVDNIDKAKLKSISLPATINTLASQAFNACSQLDSIAIPNSIEVIPSSCFKCDDNLKKVQFPNSLKRIEEQAFYQCSSLEQITLPEGCTDISSYAFAYCSRLARVNLPSTIRNIEPRCFQNANLFVMSFQCDSFLPLQYYTDSTTHAEMQRLVSPFPDIVKEGILYVPSALVDTFRTTTDIFWRQWGMVEPLENMNPAIGRHFVNHDYEFQIISDSCVSITDYYSKTNVISDLYIPSTATYEGRIYDVSTIGPNGLAGIPFVDKVILPNGLKKLGRGALGGGGFGSVEMPNSLVEIGEGAFSYCHELESIEIPASVRIIGGFAVIDALKQVILHEGNEVLGINLLHDCPKLKEIFIPESVWYLAGGELTKCESLNKIISLPQEYTYFSTDNPICWDAELIGDLAGSFGAGFGSNHETVNLHIPETTMIATPMGYYHTEWPWSEMPNKHIYQPLNSFNIPDSMTLWSTEQRMIPTEFYPADASYQMLKWTSSNDDIASVSCEGVVYAHKEGDVIITASTIDGSNIEQSCVITVHAIKLPSNMAESVVTLDNCEWYAQPGEIDTLAIPISGGERDLVVTFDLAKGSRATTLTFSTANQTYEMYSPAFYRDWDNRTSVYLNYILKIDNVQENDTLKIIYQGPSKEGINSSCYIRDLSIWNESFVDEFQNSYTLTYVVDGQVISTENLAYGTSITAKTALNKDGYTFFYWAGLPDGMTMPAHDITVTAVYAIQGDVNLDERVNITDAVGIVNDRLGYASASFYRELSDINRDELFTIADAISVLNIMYGEPINSIARAPQIYAQEDVLTLKSNADYSLALDLSTSNFYSAFQFDITMPLDNNLSDIALNESRCSGFAVQYNKIEEGKYRVVAFNLDNSPLSMVDDNLLTMSFTGVHELDNIELSNIHFSTQTGIDVMIPDISLLATSIDKTTVNDNAVEYNAAGIRLGNGAKGIVIINGKKIIKQ